MRIVFLRNNDFIQYNLEKLDGYIFNPRNKSIKVLNIINTDFIRRILSKKIKREIYNINRAIKLIVNSNVAIKSDCDMMSYELVKITNKLENRYRIYFNKFDYFENVKDLYILYNVVLCKKKKLSE